MDLLKRLITIRRHWLAAVLSLVIIAVLLAGCAPSSTVTVKPQQIDPPSSTGVVVTQGSALYDEDTVIALYEKCMPAVVQVETTIGMLPLSQSPVPLPSPFSLQIPRQRGQGSGFFIDAEGHIITNNHVVDKATQVKITLEDGTQLDANVIGTDRNNDLALLKVDPSRVPGLYYLPLADSEKVRPGQMAVALGSPFGLQGSVTVGVVSGTGRSIAGATERQITNMIQTDAAINPGNSGGPLLNSKGEVIGVNAMIEAAANGVGFAIPVNLVKTDLDQLKKGGALKTAWLGIEGRDIDAELVKELGLPIDKGIYIVTVVAGSPAENAGLKEGGKDKAGEPAPGGDIITSVDGLSTPKIAQLISYFNKKRPGDKVVLSVQRGNEIISVTAELGEWPEKLPSPLGYNQLPEQDNGGQFDLGPFQFKWR